MVLHNICIQHGLQWEIELHVGAEEHKVALHVDPTTSGQSVRQSVINNYFSQLIYYLWNGIHNAYTYSSCRLIMYL